MRNTILSQLTIVSNKGYRYDATRSFSPLLQEMQSQRSG